MRDLSEDRLLAGTKQSRDNSWGGRYQRVIPNIRRNGAILELSTSLLTVEITSFDEVVLTILMKFLFIPVWLVGQFYEQEFVYSGSEGVQEKINQWVQIGLVWRQASVTGEYIRPTYALFQLFDVQQQPYSDIPFNTLTHTVCEELVMFQVMTGSHEIVKKENVMPRVSELGLSVSSGTNIIAECDFRNPSFGNQANYERISQVEHDIQEGINRGEAVTAELLDFLNFSIIKKVDATGDVKRDFLLHIPDLIIPVVRNAGKPQSIAIEVELSNKRVVGYEETMRRYKDNNRFGVVYWLCNTNGIANSLRQAYMNVGGCGSCKVKLLEFVIPHPDF